MHIIFCHHYLSLESSAEIKPICSTAGHDKQSQDLSGGTSSLALVTDGRRRITAWRLIDSVAAARHDVGDASA